MQSFPGHCQRNGRVVDACDSRTGPALSSRAIIDDWNVRINTCDQLKSVLTESAHFDELSGHSMNTSKTVFFSTSVSGRTSCPGVFLSSSPVL